MSDQLKKLEAEVLRLKTLEEDKSFAAVNAALERWRKQLRSSNCTRSSLSTQGPLFRLAVFHHPQARERYLQWGGGQVDFEDRDTGKWDWRVYAQCDRECAPLTFFSFNRDPLLPQSGNDLGLLTAYDVSIQIDCINQPTRSEPGNPLFNQTQQLHKRLFDIDSKCQVRTRFSAFTNEQYLSDKADHTVDLQKLYKSQEPETLKYDAQTIEQCKTKMVQCQELLDQIVTILSDKSAEQKEDKSTDQKEDNSTEQQVDTSVSKSSKRKRTKQSK